MITEFLDFPGVDQCNQTAFALNKNDETVQSGLSKMAIFDFQTILRYIHENIGLDKGDFVFTGTPKGVGAIVDKDSFSMKWGQEIKEGFTVRKQ